MKSLPLFLLFSQGPWYETSDCKIGEMTIPNPKREGSLL